MPGSWIISLSDTTIELLSLNWGFFFFFLFLFPLIRQKKLYAFDTKRKHET